MGVYDCDYKQRLLDCEILPLSFRYDLLELIFEYNSLQNLNDFNCNAIVWFADNNWRNGYGQYMVLNFGIPQTE